MKIHGFSPLIVDKILRISKISGPWSKLSDLTGCELGDLLPMRADQWTRRWSMLILIWSVKSQLVENRRGQLYQEILYL